MAEINAQSFVHLDSRSLLGLPTLVATFLNSGKRDPMHDTMTSPRNPKLGTVCVDSRVHVGSRLS